MAMENTAASSNDVSAEIPPASKENLAPLNVAEEQYGTRDAIPESVVEETRAVTDVEGDFLDAENVGEDVNSAQERAVGMDSNFFSEDDEEDVGKDENGSVESFDSALERIAVASSGDPASPKDPSSPLFQAAEAPQQNALRQLNFWKNGVSSLDSGLLENVSPAEFRTHVTEIVQTQGVSADSEDVEHVVSTLLPLVERKASKDVKDEADIQSKGATDLVPVNESKDGEDNDKESRQEGISSKTEFILDADEIYVEESPQEVLEVHAEPNGEVALEQADMSNKDPADVLTSDEVANGGLEQKDTTPPETVSQLASSEGSSKDNTNSESPKDIVGESSAVTEVANDDKEPEPEVIEWDAMNESDDELGNSYSEAPPGEADKSKGMADNDPVNEDLSNDVDTELKADQESALEVLPDKDINVASKEVGADDTEAETSVPGSVGSREQVLDGADDDLKGLVAASDGLVADTSVASNEGLLLSVQPSAAQTPVSGDIDPLAQEKTQAEELSSTQAEELSSIEKAMDASGKGGLVNALYASDKGEEHVIGAKQSVDAASDEEERKESQPIVEKASELPAKEEDFEKEITSSVDTKASTTSGNESASSLGGAGPSLPVRPAGLGRSVPSLEHAPRSVPRSGGATASTRQAAVSNEENPSSTDVSEGSEDAREKLQMIRVKFLRLAHRLGQSAHNVVVAQVLYRLGLAEQLRGGRGSGRSGAFSFERASVLAEEQEAAGADDLEFGCTIMVLGKSGVGKSATINSLFDEIKSGTNAYSPATNKVQEIVGTVHGIKLRVIDTPGLLTSFADQRRNERIMSSVKRFIKKSPPDIVLYFDRLDMQSRDYGDLPLLRTITDTFGSAVWFNAIVVLTHASSAPPDGANGVPVSYEMFVAQRSHVVQQTIRQAAGDMRLMNPVSLVENHAACRRNRAGERVLPNGQLWKPQLLLLCFASKILAEANSLLKLQDNTPTKPFGVRSRVPPLPFLLSSLLQLRAQLKLPDEQDGTDDDESGDESEEEADSEGEEEYDDLPPFRRLTREELKLLDKEQRQTYAEELEYREKLFMKKQLKDERARKKEMKRRLAALPKEAKHYVEESLEEENGAASVPVPMPDMALPPSFDSDNPTFRYRYLDAANQWLVRPVLETHGWDHDSGYDGLNVEKMFVVAKRVPVSVSGQVTKDKKEANLQMECAASFKNGEGKVTQAGLDVQTIGKDLAYTLRSETRFDNFKRNKTTCGLAVILLGDTVAAGMKIEDRLLLGKRVKLVFNGGALTGRGDVAYGGTLEATIRDKDYPIGQFLSTFGLSVMDWHGDLAIGGNLQVQFKAGKTMTIVRGNLNNRRAGQVSIRVSSSEQLQIALIGLIPLLRTFIKNKILSSD